MSIGTHDLDTVEGPFTYEALPPEQNKFKPLNQVGCMCLVTLEYDIILWGVLFLFDGHLRGQSRVGRLVKSKS